MLYGVSIGPGDPELLTVKALKVIENADEVIAPGELAAKVIEGIRKPRIVEFPTGKSEEVIESLSNELAKRCINENIAFVALGDVMFYSTFMHIARKVQEINGDVKIECIPGVASFSCVFDVSLTFCDKPFGVVTAKDLRKLEISPFDYLVVMKATEPKEVEREAKRLGYRVKAVARRMFMEGEIVYVDETPDFEDYFTTVILEKIVSNYKGTKLNSGVHDE